MSVKIWEVGGAVRDEILGVPSKDVDFAVEAESYAVMRDHLTVEGFTIFQEREEFLTIRAKPPVGSILAERTNGADFVLCRKDSSGSDGRRPDFVVAGDIYDDLARRDFTVNAMAKDPETGHLLDPHYGEDDLDDRILRFVGDPETRIREDGLRVVRALRFQVTKGLEMDSRTWDAVCSDLAVEMLQKVSQERIRDELYKMFKFDSMGSMELLVKTQKPLLSIMLGSGIWLEPTMKS